MARKTIPPPPDDQEQFADEKAEKEKAAFAADDYDKQSRASEHARSENAKWVLHWVAVAIFLSFAIVYFVFLLAWALHLVMPEQYAFLTTTQLDKLQSIVLSGMVATALSKYYEKYMN